MAKKPAATPATPSYSGGTFNVPTNYQAPATTIPNPSSGITGIIGGLQTSQNQANKANALRYNQGLGTIQQGANQANTYGQAGQNSIQQAIGNTSAIGQSELQQEQLQRQQGLGGAMQSAVSRGLGNTTILNSLQSGVNRNADLADVAIQGNIQQQKNQLYQAAAGQYNQQAGFAQGGGNSIAQFIQGANQQGPDLSQYIPLVQQAAAAQQQPQKRTATTFSPQLIAALGGGAAGSQSGTAGDL